MRCLALLFIPLSLANALAPPPINFEKETVVLDDGQKIIVGWDGAQLWIEGTPKPKYDSEPVNEGPPPPGWNIVTGWNDDDEDGPYDLLIGCAWAFIPSIWLWALIILALMGKWVLLGKTFLAGMMIIGIGITIYNLAIRRKF